MRSFGIIFAILLLFVFPLDLVKAISSTDTMIGYWKFDETTQGSNASDSSGDGHPLIPNGTGGGAVPSTTLPPQISFTNTRSVQFNGTNHYYTLATNSDFNSTSLTISTWVRFNVVNNNYRTIAGKWHVGVKQQYVLQLNSNNRIGIFTGDGSNVSASVVESTATISQDVWYHVAATISGTSVVLYVTPSGGSTTTNSGTGTALGSSDIEFTVGSKKNSGGTYFEFLDGYIDDLRVYKRALTNTEVAALASGTHTSATWLGTTSQSWETASNWSPAAIPDPYTLITIPNTLNYPILSMNEQSSGVTINSAAILDLGGFSLSYNDGGSLTNNGTLYTNGPPKSIAGNSSTSNSNSEAPGCSDSKPLETPNLFQIDVAGTYANLYFTKAVGTGYAISFGLNEDANQFGDTFSYPAPDWIIGRTISHLSPNTTYFFKVRAINGCNGGDWSKVITAKTKRYLSNITYFFSNLSSQHPTLTNSATNVAGVSDNPNCSYTIKEGDTLWGIAKEKWGTGAKYRDILKNNSNVTEQSVLQIGTNIKICN